MFIASRFNSTCAPLGALCIAVFNYMPLLTERNNKLMRSAINIVLLRSKESPLLN